MNQSHKNKLGRLPQIWLENPVYFITVCTCERKHLLTQSQVYEILLKEWKAFKERHGWFVGRYVVMPDHVHFFCAGSAICKPLSSFVGSWKQWTSKYSGLSLWRSRFFDHVLRSEKSYGQIADYMEQNPVRAGLVQNVEDWPYRGDLSGL